jgi:hypothetical protein
MITLTKADFRDLGQVAQHCDQEKLEIAVQEAVMYDIKPLLCDLFWDVNDNWTDTSGVYFDLITETQYENCRGNDVKHPGVSKVLKYFAYARYILVNGFEDTPMGQVQKNQQFSIPKSYGDLKAYSNKYRAMAKESWREVEAFLCKNKDVTEYEKFGFKNCSASCDCNGDCGTKTKAKGFGVRSRNIRKKI